LPEVDVLTPARFFQMQKRSQAFSLKDIQTMAVMLHWFQTCDFTVDEILEFIVVTPRILEMFELGYFNPNPSVRQLKEIKRAESALPVEARRMWRKARLENSWMGRAYPYGTGKG
jgi:hypothetical protein